MIRRGFERRDRDNEDFGYVLTNDYVLQLCETENVISHVETQQFKYLSHISRLSNDNSAKKLLFNDNNNRKRGRPIKHWSNMFFRTPTSQQMNFTEEQ